MQARGERAIAAEGEAIVELGQADQDEREERLAVPFVVEQDVEVIEGILVKQMGLVEQEDGMDAGGGELDDVRGDGMKHAGGGGRGHQAHGEAELAVEVTPAEGGVVTVGETEGALGELMPDGAQDRGLADARLAREGDGGALVEVSKSALFDGVVITKIDGNRTAVGGCGGEWSSRQFRFPVPVIRRERGNGNRVQRGAGSGSGSRFP
jgi:hypothetical protein